MEQALYFFYLEIDISYGKFQDIKAKILRFELYAEQVVEH